MKAILLGIFASIASEILVGAILFACAGRLDLPMFWAYLGVWLAASVAGVLVADPTLIKERIRPGPGGQDYFTAIVFLPFWIGQHVVAGLDVGRFHWSDHVPFAIQVMGLLGVAIGMVVLIWAVAVNRFFSSVIRLQTDRGHHLVTGGPYRFVRHPAYAICPLLFVGTGLMLNSWLATLIGVMLVLGIVRRAAQEDRFLREHLPGYEAYTKDVRYRLVPGIW